MSQFAAAPDRLGEGAGEKGRQLHAESFSGASGWPPAAASLGLSSDLLVPLQEAWLPSLADWHCGGDVFYRGRH